MMLAFLHIKNVPATAIYSFLAVLQSAFNANVFGVWPFAGSTAVGIAYVCCAYNISDLIWAAFHDGKLELLLPFLEQLLFTARRVLPQTSPMLLDALTLLSEAYDSPDSSDNARLYISKILFAWGLSRVAVSNSITLWTDKPQIGANTAEQGTLVLGVGLLQQPRLHV